MTGHEGSSYVDIIFKARHTEVLERFRTHATAKLVRIEKLDSKAIRVDVEVMEEHNPRLANQRQRVELTVVSRGPKIRAEAAAEDRFTALDMALAKLESRLRRACDRRKDRHGAHAAVRLGDVPEADLASDAESPAIRLGAGGGLLAGHGAAAAMAAMAEAADVAESAPAPEAVPEDVVPVAMEGDGPLIVREKFHAAIPMSIDEALFEMEMVGHDFFLFVDGASGLPSVVYRRRGYQYGVIRLLEEHASVTAPSDSNTSADNRAGIRNRALANGKVHTRRPTSASSQPSSSQASSASQASRAADIGHR